MPNIDKECQGPGATHYHACACREAKFRMLEVDINKCAYERDLAQRERDRAEIKLKLAEAALELIAAPKRPDGTYNRCREACEELSRTALAELRKA